MAKNLEKKIVENHRKLVEKLTKISKKCEKLIKIQKKMKNWGKVYKNM